MPADVTAAHREAAQQCVDAALEAASLKAEADYEHEGPPRVIHLDFTLDGEAILVEHVTHLLATESAAAEQRGRAFRSRLTSAEADVARLTHELTETREQRDHWKHWHGVATSHQQCAEAEVARLRGEVTEAIGVRNANQQRLSAALEQLTTRDQREAEVRARLQLLADPVWPREIRRLAKEALALLTPEAPR